MNDDWKRLTQYLLDRLPPDVSYNDLAQLCMGLHVYVDGIPSELQGLLNKDDEAMAFAEFVRQRFDESYGSAVSARYGANFHRATEKGHWLEVIASLYKDGSTYDRQHEKAVREKCAASHPCVQSAQAPQHKAGQMGAPE